MTGSGPDREMADQQLCPAPTVGAALFANFRPVSRLGLSMRRCVSFLSLAIFCASTAHAEYEADDLLRVLSAELREAKAMPRGARRHSACPSNAKAIVGVDRKRLLTALGEPDFWPTRKKGSAGTASSWTYFLASPRPEDQRGGGFPELSFDFSSDGVVMDVRCHYAR